MKKCIKKSLNQKAGTWCFFTTKEIEDLGRKAASALEKMSNLDFGAT